MVDLIKRVLRSHHTYIVLFAVVAAVAHAVIVLRLKG